MIMNPVLPAEVEFPKSKSPLIRLLGRHRPRRCPDCGNLLLRKHKMIMLTSLGDKADCTTYELCMTGRNCPRGMEWYPAHGDDAKQFGPIRIFFFRHFQSHYENTEIVPYSEKK